MRGNTTLHSVRAVLGTEDRIAVVLAYDYPGQGQPSEVRSTVISTRAHPRAKSTRTTALESTTDETEDIT